MIYRYSESLVKYRLDTGSTDPLIPFLQSAFERHTRESILNVCTIFESKIAVKPVNKMAEKKCSWVPAAFKMDDAYRIYGSVFMGGNLIPGGAIERSMGKNSLPPKSGGSASGPNARPYYIEGCGPHGRLYGSMVGVDRITGNSYRRRRKLYKRSMQLASNETQCICLQGNICGIHERSPLYSSYKRYHPLSLYKWPHTLYECSRKCIGLSIRRW